VELPTGAGAEAFVDAEDIAAQRVLTLDAASGQPTPRCCTRAKVVDMVLLIEGGGSGPSRMAEGRPD
jgi:hypothetical protein